MFHRCKNCFGLVGVFACLFVAVVDDTAAGQETRGETIIEESFSPSSTIYLGDAGAKREIASDDGDSAILVSVPARGKNPWDVLYHSPTNRLPLRRGSLIVFEFDLRRADSSDAPASIAVHGEPTLGGKRRAPPVHLIPTPKRRVFRRVIVCPDDFSAGEFRLSIHLAQAKQDLELYRLKVQYHADMKSAETLELDTLDWPGRSPNAPWRIEANKRIDQIRKQEVLVTVTGPGGKPAPQAIVTIEQQSHAWRFGTFLGEQLLGNDDNGKRYRAVVRDRYNFVTLPAYNAKWGWQDPSVRDGYLKLARWAQQNQLPARGHVLVYPGSVTSPPKWLNLPAQALRQKLAAHIPRAIDAFEKHGVREWDVTNELRINSKFMQQIGGLQIAAEWFKAARQRSPDGTLYLNEMEILSDGGRTEQNQTLLENQFRELVAAGATIDGIGLQGHFGDDLTAPERVLAILDRMAKMTGKIMITEFDMDNLDRQAQADYLRDFYTVCFSHRAVQGIVAWGFWEGDMWKPRGSHIDRNWRELPAGAAYRKLINKWWTRSKGRTDQSGQYRDRVFKGTHVIRVEHNGRTREKKITAGEAPAVIQVVL